MNKYVAAMVLGTVLFWASGAFAQSYSAIEDDMIYGPWFGVGGALLSGTDNTGDTDTEIFGTVNLLGLTDYVAWQFYYGFNGDATAYGGNLDFLLADNFDDCDMCPDDLYWLGAGGSFISYSDAFIMNNDANSGIDDDDFGLNVGGGYMFGDWQVAFFLNYFLDSEDFMGQGMLLYNLY